MELGLVVLGISVLLLGLGVVEVRPSSTTETLVTTLKGNVNELD
jgi:hypothetical protein